MARINQAAGLQNPLQNVFPQPVLANRAPTTNDKNYPAGQQWMDQTNDQSYVLIRVSSGSAVWIATAGGSSSVSTLTGDSGGAISPSSGNINILGGDGLTVSGSGSTLTINRDAEGGYPITPYVVGASGVAGYTTIQSAITAANAAGGGMVYIQPGTYTEDLTLFDGVHLVSVIYENSFEVQITGTHTPPTSGTISFRGIRFNDATAIFSSAAAGTTSISLEECTMAVTNGYTFDLVNWTGTINCNDCGSAGTDDGFVNNTGGAAVFTNNGQFGAGTANTCNISGDMRLDLTYLDCPLDVSAGTIFVNFALFSQTVTCSGTSTGSFLLVNSFPASGASFDITTSGDITIENSTITTSNNPAIDGTGSVTVVNTGFGDNASFAATLTVGATSTLVEGTFSTLVPAAHIELSGTDIDAIGSDANISITMSPKGTGDFVVDVGDIQNTSGNIITTHSSAGASVTVQATNSDNTNAASNAGMEVAVGGSSAGDPYVNFLISGGQTFTMGIDNDSPNDDFAIANSTTVGTTNRFLIDGSTGEVVALQNFLLPTAATQLQVHGGAVTDFIGQATLASGTVTVANTNIAATDRILLTRADPNSSTALGELTITALTASTSFVITALSAADGTTTVTGDTSIVNYFIVRQLA